MPRISPPGHTPISREPEVTLDVGQRATVKAWIQAYIIAENKRLKYSKEIKEAIKNFRGSLGIITSGIITSLLDEIKREWGS